MDAVLSDMNSEKEDIDTPEVTHAVTAESLKSLAAERADVETHCADKRIDMIVKVSFGQFNVHVSKHISLRRQGKGHRIAGHAFARLTTCSERTKPRFQGRSNVEHLVNIPQH